MTKSTVSRAALPVPSGLRFAGSKLWRDVTSTYVLRVDELAVLESAARTVDTIAGIDQAMEGEPMIVKGSQGQLREHPLISEGRQQRAALARLLRQLALADVDAEMGLVGADARSSAGRALARQRWGA
jgi:hypothetical protein